MAVRDNKTLPVIPAIYMIVNICNDKYYIGSAVDVRNRVNYHLSVLSRNVHHNNYLQAAWNKYGRKNFIYLILERVSKENLELKEQWWIDKLKASNSSYGYNLRKQANSNQGYKFTEEAKRKIGAAKIGKPRSEETKEKLRIAAKNQVRTKRTIETKIKMSEAAKLRWRKYHDAKSGWSNNFE